MVSESTVTAKLKDAVIKGHVARYAHWSRQLVLICPGSPDGWLHRSDALIQMARYSEAYDCAEKALRLLRGESRSEAHLKFGYLYEMKGEVLKAEQHYALATEMNPSAENLSALGEFLFKRERFEEANELLYRTLRLNSEMPMAYYNLGRISRAQGDMDASLEHFKQAAARNPSLSFVKDAIADLESLSLDTFKGETPVSGLKWEYIDAANAENRPTWCVAYLRRLASVSSLPPIACLSLSGALSKIGLHKDALAAANTALGLFSREERFLAHRQKGYVLKAKNDIQGAARSFRRCLVLSSDPFQNRLDRVFLGACYARLGWYEKAVIEYCRAAEIDQQKAEEAYLNLGLIARAKEEYALALSHFRDAIRINPKCAATEAQEDVTALLEEISERC